MINKTNFFTISLIAVLVVNPAFSDEPATQNWVKTWVPGWAENRGIDVFRDEYKKDFYSKKLGENLSKYMAENVRDQLYIYDKQTKAVTNPLHTTGQNAFDGINEVLEKVDGSDGTSGSAVQLETTAQNAYGAINELKDEIAGLQDQVDTKVSSDGLSETVTVVVEEQIGEDLDTVYDVATGERKSVAIVDVFTEKDFEEIRK